VGEAGAHRHLSGLEFVQAVPGVGDLAGQGGQGPGGAGGQPGSGDPDRQRQQPARGGQFRGGVWLVSDPLVTHDPVQQVDRLGGGQRMELDEAGSGRAGEFAAAGDQDRALAGAGQQRLDLGCGGGVVGEHQDPPPGQDRAVQRGPLTGRTRHGGAGHAECPAQLTENLAWVAGMPGTVLKRRPQLAVGVFGAQFVRDVQGQRGLAHPGQTDDHRDRDADPVVPVTAEEPG
jgi:hypothetical protein